MFGRLAVFVLWLGMGTAAWATTTIPLGLVQLEAGARAIFHGQCIANRVELDAGTGAIVTYSTFQVRDAVKGPRGQEITIKQIGGQLPGSEQRLVIPDVPHFTVGEEYVVFLPQASSLGFSSPVGLSQGAFLVRPDTTGAPAVSNGRDVAELIQDVPATAIPANIRAQLQTQALRPGAAVSRARTELPLADFLNIVRQLRGPR